MHRNLCSRVFSSRALNSIYPPSAIYTIVLSYKSPSYSGADLTFFVQS